MTSHTSPVDFDSARAFRAWQPEAVMRAEDVLPYCMVRTPASLSYATYKLHRAYSVASEDQALLAHRLVLNFECEGDVGTLLGYIVENVEMLEVRTARLLWIGHVSESTFMLQFVVGSSIGVLLQRYNAKCEVRSLMPWSEWHILHHASSLADSRAPCERRWTYLYKYGVIEHECTGKSCRRDHTLQRLCQTLPLTVPMQLHIKLVAETQLCIKLVTETQPDGKFVYTDSLQALRDTLNGDSQWHFSLRAPTAACPHPPAIKDAELAQLRGTSTPLYATYVRVVWTRWE